MATAPPAPNETSVLIMGHRVAFPAGKSPFPAQLAVMSSTLSALNRKQHALVESPTGSGKTLALLSSCLTFQRDIVRQEFAELQHRQVETAQQQTQQTKQGSEWDDDAFELLQRSVKRVKREADNTAAIIADDEAIENLQQVQDLAQEYSQQESHEESQQTQESAAFGPDDLQQQQQSEVITPRIYFCSRTHSQLAQVVKELKGCPESYMATPDLPVKLGETTLRSCVLGSKRVMCVNEEVNDEPSLVNARCQELRMEKERKMANAKNEEEMDEAGCPYSQTSFSQLRQRLPQIWDIEDVTKTAPSCKECAYFFSKNLLEKAHIVFCPYNYILDPSIRKAVGITLHNSIVVLDEAHNVEDTCRSGASLELTDNILAASIKSFDDVLKQETHIMIPEAYDAVRYALSYVKTWFNTNEDLVRDPGDPDEDDCYMLWSTEDALAMLRECGLAEVGESDMDQIVQNQQMMMNSPGTKILLNSLALSTATRVISVASYMLRSNGKDADDFKVVITKKRRRTEDTEIIDTKLCIWCLSAAVVFSDVAFQARSVILASGTLSPMDSFAGELGVDFPIRLEANHVVNMRKQVFVGAVMHGPGGVDLISTYKNQQKFQYQDSLGEMLLQYAQVIPGGILLFVPSYALIAALEGRWKRMGTWERLEKYKRMFSEPRVGGKEFDELLDEYKRTISAGLDYPSGWDTDRNSIDEPRQSGAIFIAVYRGKVSEGIDFSDANARAVLCVGIPFPNFKDLQVSLKREYQDKKCRLDSKLVNGSLWYKLQAFRALNQALGRCIRHRRDYGAIILIDSRHRGNMHGNSLSKWMRPHVQEFGYSEECNPLFTEFFQRNRIEMPTLGPAPAQEPVPALIPAFTSTTGTSGSPLVLEYEENASIKNEPRSWSGEVKFEPLAVPGEYGLAPVPTFLSAVGTADAPIELEDEDLTTIKYESQGGIASIKNEPSPALVEPAPPPTPALPSVLGTVNHPIVLDFDDSVPVKMETCAASGR